MKKTIGPHFQQQKVNTYFESQSTFWREVYEGSDVYAEIHRDRHAVVLNWIDNLALPPGTDVLEIGCGAGLMSVALARRGFDVHAIDSAEAMVEQVRRLAGESGVTESLSLSVGNVYALAFEDESFDLVIAIGVIPWLERAELAIKEMARVTRQGGQVILTADNRTRLNNLLDPWLNPALSPLKQWTKEALDRTGLRHRSLNDIDANYHSRRFIDQTLSDFNLVKTRSMTLGFGPFSLFHRAIFPDAPGVRLHHRLQRLSNRNVPLFRSTGAHYIVQARKTAVQPPRAASRAQAGKSISDATNVF